jgi:hypothetical protein
MISVAELDSIARARIEDARALLHAGRFDGATYLCGYSEFEAYRSFQTHELDVLLHLSGQEDRLKRAHFITSQRLPGPAAA